MQLDGSGMVQLKHNFFFSLSYFSEGLELSDLDHHVCCTTITLHVVVQ